MTYPYKKLVLISVFLNVYLILPVFSEILLDNTYSFLISSFGNEDDTLIVYDYNAKSPANSKLPLNLFGKLISVNGVISVSPEIIAFTMINRELVITRGVDIVLFSKINSIDILEGRNLSLPDTLSAILGYQVAKELNLKVGEKVLVKSATSNEVLELEIVGIFKSEGTYNQEIFVPLFVAATLANIPTDYVSFYRVKVDKNLNVNALYELIKQNEAKNIDENILVKFLMISDRQMPELNIRPTYRSMEEFFIKQLNLSQYTLMGFSLTIIFLTLLLLNSIIEYYRKELEDGIKVFKVIGGHKYSIFKYLSKAWILIFAMASILSLITVYFIVNFFNYYLKIKIWGYQLNISFEPLQLLIVYLITLILSFILLYLNVKKE